MGPQPPSANGPAFGGAVSDQLANPPASVRIANSTAGRRCHDRRRYHHARRRSAEVHTAVVAVATAAAIRASVKARSAATSDRNCQASLYLFDRREWHGLSRGNADEAETND